ncbi:hypothetical protein ABK040_010625 [Willaertia magna]
MSKASGDTVVKCVVVGDGAVGKTCMLLVYAEKPFLEKYVPTVFDNYACTVKVDNKPVNFTLWDTAGQEDYDRLRPLSYHDTNVFLLCFSVVEYSSFENVKIKWTPEITHHQPSAHVILVGTKIDLKSDEDFVKRMREKGTRVVEYREGVEMAKKLGFHTYVECSSKTGENLKRVFDEAIRVSLYGSKTSSSSKKQSSGCHLL